MLKIEGELHDLEDFMYMATFGSDGISNFYVGVSLDNINNRVIITPLHMDLALNMVDTSKINEMMDNNAIIENFESLERAAYFYEEMRDLLKLSIFIKSRTN